MSYLQMLQQARQQDADANARLWGALGNAAMTFADLKIKGDERARTQAQDQAKLFQQMGGAMLQSGQGRQAAELLPKFREAVKTGYGVDLPNTTVVGAPVMGQVPNPDFIGPMPLGQQAMKRGEVGRDFGGDQTLAAIRGGLMLEKPKRELTRVSPYDNLVDERTGEVVFRGQDRPGKMVPSYNADGTITYREVGEGLTVGAKPTAEKLFMSYGPDGSITLVPGAAGTKLGARPVAQANNARALQQWETNRVRYVKAYVDSAVRQLPTDIEKGVPVKRAPTPEFLAQKTAEAEAYYDANVTRPFEQPGSGQAAPTVRGVRSSAIQPPKDYNDTSLLPQWEKLAQQAVSLAPGATISSRARSKERNANAGGVAASWHQYRQAFDLVVPRPEDRAKLIQWGRQRGLEVIDEGDHLHFEPARSSDAMRNFYAKHGLESDDA